MGIQLTQQNIRIRNVTKRFGRFQALDDVSLEIPAGKLVSLLGPSGSGKTTLLRIIAGLETPDEGAVLYQNEEVTGRPARERNIGFVFQHYALFRHMSVFENVAFGLRVRRWPQAKVQERVFELLRLIRLEGMEKRFPSQLSGGQRQRVALARALAAEPRVLLLDEPFGALDARVRQELREWLRRLHEEIHVTSIFVTHDQEEAFAVADQVVVLRSGRIEQVGSPQEVFERPANAFVMDFLGNVNVFQGHVRNGRASMNGMEFHWPDYPHDEQRPASMYIRPHELEIDRDLQHNGSHMQARVLHVNPVGPVIRVHLETLEARLALHVELSPARAAELSLRIGDVVAVAPRQVRVFVPDYSI